MDTNRTTGSTLHAAARLLLCVLGVFCVMSAVDSGGWADPVPFPADGDRYTVDALVIEYEQADPGLPAISELLDTEIALGVTEDGYVAVQEGLPSVRLRLDDIDSLQQKAFYATALRAISHGLVAELNRRGYVDIYVAPTLGQFSATGRDLRPDNELELRLAIKFGEVTEVVTTASGDRFAEPTSNSEVHRRIVDRSPVGAPGDDATSQVIRKDLLDDYLFQLNRHPGRRVDATLSPSAGGRGVALEYVVTENRPWLGYVQMANTGTKNTAQWRQRIGYVNNQLSNRDDILSIDYITAGFDSVNAAVVNYEAPFFDVRRTRWRGYGNVSEFNSSDVGIFGTDFSGDDSSIGFDVYHTFYQKRELFFDYYAGASYRSISAENVGIGGSGDDNYFLPHLGIRMERNTDYSSTTGSMVLEINASGIAGTDSDESELLGRTDPDTDWQVFRLNVSHSFYLEPILFPDAWADSSTPYSSTMAHEVVCNIRYQNSLGNRLIPHEQQTVGGLYSVRGYDESVASGDDSLIANFEYRLHIPRIFKPQPYAQQTLFGKSFRMSRDSVYGRPDWDLVAKAFFDVGRVDVINPTFSEEDHTLFGAGFGLDFLLWKNWSVRADYGVALRDVDSRASSGDSEIHVVATLLF
ncbi:MAG: hypothetical protein AAF581_16595 [Planctomycetota bacterium]